MKVKICGITNLDDARMCQELGADMLGFVHVPGRERSLPLAEISNICSTLGPTIERTLACSPRDVQHAQHLLRRSGADILQTYTLDPDDLVVLRSAGAKVFRVVPPDRSEAARFASAADALVFESGSPGTGSSYDYSAIPIDCCDRAIIAGGLNPGNVLIAKALQPYALDVSSGVERSPLRKDRELVSEFIRRCHE